MPSASLWDSRSSQNLYNPSFQAGGIEDSTKQLGFSPEFYYIKCSFETNSLYCGLKKSKTIGFPKGMPMA